MRRVDYLYLRYGVRPLARGRGAAGRRRLRDPRSARAGRAPSADRASAPVGQPHAARPMLGGATHATLLIPHTSMRMR